MTAWWLTFTDGSAACCEGGSAYDAKRIAEHLTDKTVAGGEFKDIAATPLPYPATPIIWQLDHPVSGKTPTFCYRPAECAGKSALEAEGVEIELPGVSDESDAIETFANLWDSINAKRGHSWESNPWVWVVEFKAVPRG